MMSIESDWSAGPEGYKRLETLISKEIKSGTFPGVEIITQKEARFCFIKHGATWNPQTHVQCFWIRSLMWLL